MGAFWRNRISLPIYPLFILSSCLLLSYPSVFFSILSSPLPFPSLLFYPIFSYLMISCLILSYLILSSPLLSYPIIFYSIVLYCIVFYFILFYSLLFYSILSNPIQSNPIQSNPIQSNPILSNPILSYPILSYFKWNASQPLHHFYFILFYRLLSSPLLFSFTFFALLLICSYLCDEIQPTWLNSSGAESRCHKSPQYRRDRISRESVQDPSK